MSVFVDIEKNLGAFRLNVQFEAGDETLALLGASGCGNSITLKCIAGIERPDRGRIVVDGVTLFDSEKKIDLTPQQRRTGLMFQSYALFPHMTVLQNLRAGANREPDRAKRDAAVAAVLARFGLADLAGRYPRQLSGGQQQRVALARILVSDPQILLLDEPFSALDSHLRFRLEQDLRQVIRRFGKTVLLVSHDRDEVFRLSDRIAVMDGGRIQALGGKHAVFADPQTRSAAVLTGCKNISAVKLLDETHVQALDWGITLSLPRPVRTLAAIGIRMHDVCPDSGPNSFRCQVAEVIENPFSYTLMLRPLGAEHAVPLGLELGKAQWDQLRADTLTVSLPPEKLLLLEAL